MNKFQNFLKSFNTALGKPVFEGNETEDEATAKLENLQLGPAPESINAAVEAAVSAKIATLTFATVDQVDSLTQSVNGLTETLNSQNQTEAVNKIKTDMAGLATTETVNGLKTELEAVKGNVAKLANDKGGNPENGNQFQFPNNAQPKKVEDYDKVDAGL